MKRRDFFKLMGAISGSILASCDVKKAPQKLIPYLVPPDDGVIPGEPVWSKSTCTECPVKCGLLVKNRENRAVKLEGLPDHPFNHGALCVRGQASLERLYHPNRLRTPLKRKKDGGWKPVSWQESLEWIQNTLKENSDKKHIYLSSRTTGTLRQLLNEFSAEKGVRLVPQFEIVNYYNLKKAYQLAFGIDDIPVYTLKNADLMITIGADILDTFLNPIQFAGEVEELKRNGVQWLHIEPTLTLTGAKASKRITCNPGSEHYLLAYLLEKAPSITSLENARIKYLPSYTAKKVSDETGIPESTLKSIVQLLQESSAPVLLSGGIATSHANGFLTALLTAILQFKIGMVNRSMDFSRTWNYSQVGSIAEVNGALENSASDEIGILFVSRIFDDAYLPSLKKLVGKATLRVGISDFAHPFLEEFDLLLPLSHSLESWGDEESVTGIQSVIQPVMEPIFNTLSEGDILLRLMGRDYTYQEYLFAKWKEQSKDLVEKGVIERPVSRKTVYLNITRISSELEKLKIFPFNPSEKQLVVLPSVRKFDGRSKELSLVSEIPDPLTTVSYGEWVSVNPVMAEELGLETGDVVNISTDNGNFQLPVKIQYGIRKNVFQVHLEHIRFSENREKMDEYAGVLTIQNLEKTGKKEAIPVLSGSVLTDNRGILPDEHEEHHHGEGRKEHKLYTLYKEHEHEQYRWAMAINLDACTGCSACVAACYVENNVAITGKEEHLKGREMAWIRIEPYYDNQSQPRFVPVMCQQCDNAPCESVCPVFATYHNPEGLNAQVYNRCVGTRYCSNNCPYKARRFNWFDYTRKEPFHLMLNPDVSDRPRGVMEKCTFCIQRIRYAKDHARDEGRLVQDGEVIPACAQTCPTKAITFGNIMDTNSEVYARAHQNGSYRLLEELGTRPAVYYISTTEQTKGTQHES